MRKFATIGLIGILGAATGGAMAQPSAYAKIDAQFAIIGKHLVDPSPDEKRDPEVACSLPERERKVDAMPVPAIRSPL